MIITAPLQEALGHAGTLLLVCMLMIVADASGAFQLALEISLCHILGLALCTYDDLDVVLVEDLNSTATHPTADNDVYAHVIEEVGQETRLVPGVPY